MTELDRSKYYEATLRVGNLECSSLRTVLLSHRPYSDTWMMRGSLWDIGKPWDMKGEDPRKVELRLKATLEWDETSRHHYSHPIENLSVRFFGFQRVRYESGPDTVLGGDGWEFACDFHVVEPDELVPDCVVG